MAIVSLGGLLYLLPPLCCGLFFALRVIQLHAAKHNRRKAVLDELKSTDHERKRLIGFFHPYCNAGGGGERVLWTAIAMLQRFEPEVVNIVYTGDIDVTKEQIIERVKARFDIELAPSSLHFVFLHSRYLVEDTTWRRFTLLGQSIGSMYLAWEAMSKLVPDLYIDTMGYAFTFPVVRWLALTKVGAYVHYPTISTDMLERVRSRRAWHTNSGAIASSAVLSKAKLLYYRMFMFYYAGCLRTASFLMVNSSWTKNHVDAVLQHSDPLLSSLHILGLLLPASAARTARIVYPPCDTRDLATFPLEGRERVIFSLAQFRPEKDHPAQLRAFHRVLADHPEYGKPGPLQVRLVMMGGSRNAEDAARIDALRELARELGIEEHVEIIINASYPQMLNWLSRASIGLSTMVDEHFGINVVEFMAAGVIPVTHASGGPLNDIVVPFNGSPTGFHATSPETFAEAFHKVLTLSPEEEVNLRSRARTWAVQRFSEEEFEKGWNESGWQQTLRG
ncbi:hypothetical protein IEO21_06998 [Rhodonia placenta]|uniref:GDP-Man:Man(3)GlcNAc(2)-PP-Dol alpha-1,2-mannosyltransferase n=1 Tax=Rhodonia placenta TaxID=104341 RepID=A0A8H7U0K4_9APHY|nr:hypothetical protein IEO21_06998 [Postia placenta]